MRVHGTRGVRIGASLTAIAIAASVAGCASPGASDTSSSAFASSLSSAPAATSESVSPSATAAPPSPAASSSTAPAAPVAAPARSDPNAGLGLSGYTVLEYPTAYEVSEAVWEDVGPGWSVEVVSSVAYPYGDPWQQPAAVLYVVDPDDTYYEVAELPERMWADARVVSWIEDQEFVRLTWGGGWESARYDLRTGNVLNIIFASYGQNAYANMFVAADAEGNELWSAESNGGTKLYRWDGSTGDWAASSLVTEHPDADAWWVQEFWRTEVSEDGRKVVLHVDSAPDTFSGDFVVYDLTTDTSDAFTVPELVGSSSAVARYGVDDDVFIVDWYEGAGAYDLAAGTVTTITTWDDTEMLDATWDGRVGWGESTDPDAAFWSCNC